MYELSIDYISSEIDRLEFKRLPCLFQSKKGC